MKEYQNQNQNQSPSQGKVKKVILVLFFFLSGFFSFVFAQVNTDRVMAIGRNALYFEDYVLSIQYFNHVIKAKPYLAEPYLYRAIAKFNLEDYRGAENDITLCLERNPFLVLAYQCRGGARQNLQDYPGAIQDYDKGLEFRPEDRNMLINKGIVYFQLKDYERGIEVLDTLITLHPKFTSAYLIRGAAYSEKEDTVKAMADFDTAVRLDKYFAPSYGQRGLFYFKLDSLDLALADLNRAIHIDPLQVGYYINRGLIRYYLNDLRGAMADYDVVVHKEPNNIIARFNRGLLRAQVGDNNRSIEDFDVVIQQEPDNYMAIFNRALLREEVGEYSGAIADYNAVLAEYPNFLPAYYARAQVKRALHDIVGADKDYWYAYELEERLNRERAAGKKVTGKGVYEAGDAETADSSDKTREKSDKNIEKFNRLVVYDKEEERTSRYSNELRGKVQDRQVKIDLESPFVITYYEKIETMKRMLPRDKMIDDYNKSGYLSALLIITNKEAAVSDEQANEHFRSIDDFSLRISQNPADANVYFGRALDFMIVQDLNEALNDLSSAIQYAPNFALAYFNRGVVRYKLMEINQYNSENTDSSVGHALSIQLGRTASAANAQPAINVEENKEGKRNFELELIGRDYDTCIRLNPDFVYAYFNKGNIRCMQKDYRSAILEYNEAIKRNPDFAEAFFNRGLTRLSLGDTEKGIEDLSKAGELGLVDAYGIIKRMTE